jgi:hypothetical protein
MAEKANCSKVTIIKTRRNVRRNKKVRIDDTAIVVAVNDRYLTKQNISLPYLDRARQRALITSAHSCLTHSNQTIYPEFGFKLVKKDMLPRHSQGTKIVAA